MTQAFLPPWHRGLYFDLREIGVKCRGPRGDSLLHVGVCCTLLSCQVLLKGVQRDRKHSTPCCQPGCSPRTVVYEPPSLQRRSPTQSACYLNVLQHHSSKQRVPGDAHSALSALQSQLKRISVGYVVAMGHVGRSYVVAMGHVGRSWLRHCATCRKVAGSIPDCVIGIFH